jgi:hypothetical protein
MRRIAFFRAARPSRHVHKLPLALSTAVILVSLLSGQQQVPSKEYIRIGGRVVAVENPSATVTVCPQNATVGLLDVLQFTASTQSSCAPTSPATWSEQNGSQGAATISSSGLLSPTAAGTVTVQATIGGVTSTGPVTIVSVFSVPSISALDNGQLQAGGIEQFTVTKQGSWTLTSPGVSWFQFASANSDGSFSGNGPTTVGYSIAANNGANPVNLALTLTGTTNGNTVTATLPVSEAGTGSGPPTAVPTSISLAGSNDTVLTDNNTTNTFTVQVGYNGEAWSVNESTLPTGVTLDQNSVAFANSQSASGTVTFDFAANASSGAQSGSICILYSTVTCTNSAANVAVSQAGGLTFNPPGSSAAQLPASSTQPIQGTVNVTAPTGTPWKAVVPNAGDAAWLSVPQGASGAAGATTSLTYTAQTNTTGSSRQGTIVIGGLAYKVSQAAAASVLQISPAEPPTFSAAGSVVFTAEVNSVPQSSASWQLTSSCNSSLNTAGTSGSSTQTATGSSVTYYSPTTSCAFHEDILTASVSGFSSASVVIFIEYPGNLPGPTFTSVIGQITGLYFWGEISIPSFFASQGGQQNSTLYSNTQFLLTGNPSSAGAMPSNSTYSCPIVANLGGIVSNEGNLGLQADAGFGTPATPNSSVLLAAQPSQAVLDSTPELNVPFNDQCELDPSQYYTYSADGSSLSVNIYIGARLRPAFAAANAAGYTFWMYVPDPSGGAAIVNPIELTTWTSPAYQPPTINLSNTSTPVPASPYTVGGLVTFAGWAYDNANNAEGPINNVQILVDNQPVKTINAPLGSPPSDATCPSYLPFVGTPGAPGFSPTQPAALPTSTLWDCPNTDTTQFRNLNLGWSYQWDTTLVTNGSHTITAVATDSDPTPHSSSTSLTYPVYNLTATAPTFSPVAGSYAAQTSVTLVMPSSMSGLSGAAIYYTTNGTTPTRSNHNVYSSPISITQTTTVNAIVHVPGYIDSPVATAVYTITTAQVQAPVINPGTGTYATAQSVTLTSGTSAAIIMYTTGGTMPNGTNGTTYTPGNPIPVTATTTINAMALKTGMTNSAITSATLTILPPVAAPAFSPVPGTYNLGENVSITSATTNASIRFTTDGVTVPTETIGTLYSGPISVASTKTIQAIAFEAGMADSPVISATYTIVPAEQIVTPAPAVGMSVNFTVQDEDIASATDVSVVGMLVGNDWNSTQNACYFQVYIVGGSTTSYVQFFNNDGVTYQPPVYLSNLSPSAPLSNSQCSLQGVTFSQSGSQFIWSPTVTLTSAFAAFGSQNVFTYMQTQEGYSAWETATTWNPTGTTALMGAAKVGIFRDGFEWILDANGDEQFSTPPDFVYAYGGILGDLPITGDWNGSGTTKVGIFRTHGGKLQFILDSNGDGVFDTGDAVYNFGTYQAGDLPVVGDWNGDGTTKVGVFRGGYWWMLDYTGTGTTFGVQFAFGGVAGDVPVVGDWNGDGHAKAGVFRDGYLWVLDGADPSAPQADHGVGWSFAFGGIAGDVPVVGDWTGDGQAKAGVFRYGYFWVLDGADATAPQANHFVLFGFPFGGVPQDLPVVGRWVN